MKFNARSASSVAIACLLLHLAACIGVGASEADTGRPDIFGADTGGAIEDTEVDSGAGDAEADTVADTDPTDTALDTTTDTDPTDTAADTAPDTTADTSGTPICGNGTVEAGEACDDGNRLAGDGCSFSCTIECGAGNDSDFDGICNGSDVCPGFDDNLDVDANGIPDGCEGSRELCTDRIDNDLDGATDCADTECSSLPVCTAVPTSEANCSDAIDNDLDRYADCLDLDCVGDPACGPADGAGTCASPRIITGPGIYDGSTIGLSNSVSPGCAPDPDSPDEVYTFRAPSAGTWCFWVTEGNFNTVVDIRRGCTNAGSEVTCNDDGSPIGLLLSQVAPNLNTTTDYFVFITGSRLEDFGDYRLFVRPGSCPATLTETCNNSLDDDADGLVDCDDTNCVADANCISLPEVCNDSRDNDLDGLVDCFDTDCSSNANCLPVPEVCTDARDNDIDTLVDCFDPDCAADVACLPSAEVCSDAIDNDRDGLIDCSDSDCLDAINCIPVPEVCTDGRDNDLDTLIDCSDPDCASQAVCLASPEVCNDGRDNDLDGNIDCDDSQCTSSYCTPTGNGSCSTPTDIGSFGTFTGATSFSNREGTCGGLGYEEAIRWRAPLTGNICVQLEGRTNFDAVLYARTVCTSTTELACSDDYSETSYGARIDLAVTNASPYFLFADTFAVGDRGTWNLTISRGTCAEVYGSEASCIDGLDNDADLGIDCADADCASDPACP